MKSIYIISLLIMILPSALLSQNKRLFIKSFERKRGVSREFAEKFRDKLMLYYFEEGRGAYRVLGENDIKIMYEQAEELLKMGCDAEECLLQIAYTIDADVIIYGKIEKDGGKINVLSQSLIRDRESDELIKHSIVNVSFYESQVDWYAKEMVKKLINPTYFIDKSKAPLEIKIEVSSDLLKTTSLESKELKMLKFKTDDTALQTIISILKDIISRGDNFYKNKDMHKARLKYNEVLEKIRTKISTGKQVKLGDLKEDVYERIAATYAHELQKILAKADEYLKKHRYNTGFQTYQKIDRKIDAINLKQVKKHLKKYKQITKERRDLAKVTLSKFKIQKGDGYYSDYKFEEAIEEYNKAINYLTSLEIKDNKEHNKLLNRAKEKKAIARKTGESYFNNRVQSYCDKIDVYNLKDDIENAKAQLLEFYNLNQSSKFADFESRKKLEEMASLLKMTVDEIENIRKEQEARLAAEKQERERRKAAERRERESGIWFSKRLAWDLECGSGHMFNSYLSCQLGRLLVGAGGSLTYDNEEVLGQTFKGYLCNFTGNLGFNFVQSSFFWMDVRCRAGYEWITFDKWSEKGSFLSTDLLIGYHNLYGAVAVPMFFGRLGMAIEVQMGLGIRARF